MVQTGRCGAGEVLRALHSDPLAAGRERNEDRDRQTARQREERDGERGGD